MLKNLIAFLVLFGSFERSTSKNYKVRIYGKVGSSLTLNCKNVTRGTFINVVWLTNANSQTKYTAFQYNRLGEVDTHSEFKNRIKRVNGTSIQIRNSRLTDSGDWECNMIYTYIDEDGSRKRVDDTYYDVQIVSPPTIGSIYPLKVAAPLSFQTSAVCNAYSPNQFELTWIKVHGNFTKFVTVYEDNEGFADNKYKKTSHLKFEELSHEDVGRYLCVAKNIAGQVSREVDVYIQAKPTMLIDATHFHVNIGDSVELRCVAMGYPKVFFEWLFTYNYEQIHLKSSEKNGDMFRVSRTRFQRYEGKELSTSVLKINNVNQKHWGKYKCQAENSIGYADVRFVVQGYSIPDPPALLNTDEIKAHQITLFWLLDKSNGVIKSVVIERRQMGRLQWDRVEVHKAITKYTFSNLEENSLFEFRLKAKNIVGLSKYSEIQKLRTKKILIVVKSKKVEDKGSKKIIFNLNIVALTAVCGGILLFITCVICTITILAIQRKKYRRKKKRRPKKEIYNDETLVPLQNQNIRAV